MKKTTKPKKRWLTAQQIRDEIDAQRAKSVRLLQTAEALELAAQQLEKIPEMIEDAKWKKFEAKCARRRSARITNVRLAKLKEKLAELNTELLPNIVADGDRSIQA